MPYTVDMSYEDATISNDEKKTARLEARLPAAIHALLQRAAAIQGRSMSEFVVAAAREAAEEAIATHDAIRITRSDQERFAAALIDPAVPAPALERAAARHDDLVEPL